MSTAADPSSIETASETPLVLQRREGSVTRVTLNRPRAINALNLEMFHGIGAAIEAAQRDDSSAIVLDGAGDRGFCGGGDVKEISAGDSRAILAVEYRVDHAIATSAIPVVGLMDGVTMGGGIGLTGHASHRVVTERSRLAMPEARIGIAPDVGGNLLLARAPGRLGELLAATSADMNAGDAIALGFADYFVPSERLPQLIEALAAGTHPDVACERFAEPAPEASLVATSEWWSPIAEVALSDVENDPRAALLRLLEALDAATAAAAQEAAATIRSMCPMSVAVSLAQVSRTRRLGLSLAEVLADDLRVVSRLAERADFAEGVRAQVIDKDCDPRWSPEDVAGLDPEELQQILSLQPRPGETPLAI